ncbi:Thioredoxin-1 [Dactylellina cionopaga]|nr:Thioredoxin-1 [Dactylellina cionopaga]
MSEEHSDAVYAKVDVEAVPDIAAMCGIRAMPTFQVFRNGGKIKEVVGANPAAVESAVKASLATKRRVRRRWLPPQLPPQGPNCLLRKRKVTPLNKPGP